MRLYFTRLNFCTLFYYYSQFRYCYALLCSVRGQHIILDPEQLQTSLQVVSARFVYLPFPASTNTITSIIYGKSLPAVENPSKNPAIRQAFPKV